ncbi:hypothetical protein GGH18_000824 [Coemansia sp. RSA 530]|nr:hypothetical protein GGH16_000549 [Coemansia sp. RSA 560]KAJ2198855.1 hypothetical protein GGH18_000824 [Coemansia sp. RSA 530]
MTLQDPTLLPAANMRPWTASSRSLPLAVPSPHFAESERPSSSASSATGMPPMGGLPLANTVLESSPKAPTPTMASLDAYRTSIKRSNDSGAQLDFAKYVLEHARGIADNEPSLKLVKKRYDMLTEEGLKWVRKLAGTGITVHRSNIAAESQYFLGTVHSRGIYGVPRDDSKAFAYYQQASKAQHAEANYRTAVCYEVGVGTRRDPTRALQFYRKAAAQTNVPAMYKLGLILIKGLMGITPAPREGINWLKRGADNATPECPHSLHELALCHESSDIPGVIPDETYARQLYIKAGKLGYVPSQVRLGQAYEYGSLGCPVDSRRSIGWYTRAAEKNDADAELALSGWYLTGAEPHLPQNDVEAFLWARRAADRKLAKAEYAVGYYYECGIGVAHPDVNEAQKWYLKAAHQNNRRAANRLKELKQMGVNVVPLSNAARPRRGKGSLALQTAFTYVGIGVVAYYISLLITFIYDVFVRSGVPLEQFGAGKGAWAVVTGCTDGLGRETALELAGKRFNVLLLSRSQDKLDDMAKKIEELGVEARTLAVDFGKMTEDKWQQIAQEVQAVRVGVLVNNVGVSYDYPMYVEEVPAATVDAMVELNMRAMVRMTQAVIPQMKERKSGLIINSGSFACIIPSPFLSVYAGSKGFVKCFTQSLAAEAAPFGVVVEHLQTYFVCSRMSKMRKPNFLIPLPKTYMKTVLAKIGVEAGSSELFTSIPFFSHALMAVVVERLVPKQVTLNYNYNLLNGLRKRALKKIQRQQEEQVKAE